MDTPINILRRLVEEISDKTLVLTQDIFLCGSDVFGEFQQAACTLFDQSARAASVKRLDGLIDTSYDRMSSSSGALSWRRLYTDACILRSLADVAFDVTPEARALEAIARLDHAIVIAGAPGEGRIDFILDCIRQLQQTYLPPRPFQPAASSAQAETEEIILEEQVASSSSQIPCIDPPSLTTFRNLHSQAPFILRGYIKGDSGWSAMDEHPWSSTQYLRSIAGPGRVVPVEVGKDYRDDDWTQKMMNWDDFLDTLDSPEKPVDVLYLAQHNLMMQFPDLRNDIMMPEYVYSCPEAPIDFPDYTPPGNGEELVINAWLGPKGTVSPAHTDPYFNLYAQVVGRKTVWLAPPSVSASMYSYPPAKVTDKSHTHNPAANTTNPSMSNTSQVNVFNPSEDHREFEKSAISKAMSAVLEPGDLLFFPPGWWHAMRSEEKSFSVSMWF